MTAFTLPITCEADRRALFDVLCFPNTQAARNHVSHYTATIADERRHLRAFLSAAPDPDPFVRRYMQPLGHRWAYARVVCARLRAWRAQRVQAQARVVRMQAEDRETRLRDAFAAEAARRCREVDPMNARVLTIAPDATASALAGPSIKQREVMFHG